MKQLEKAVSGKEPRYVLRALRALPSTSRRLNSNVLHKAINGFFTSNSTVRDFLLGFLEEVQWQGMGRGDRLRRGLLSHTKEPPECGRAGREGTRNSKGLETLGTHSPTAWEST